MDGRQAIRDPEGGLVPNTNEQTRYIAALCQIETGIVHEGQLYLPFADLVAMVRNMPQIVQIDQDRSCHFDPTTQTRPAMGGVLANPESWMSY